MGVPCGTKFLRSFIFADGHFFCFAETNVMKQECSVIVRWRDFTPLNFVINSFTLLSDFTDCGGKHSKYSIKLTT